MQKWEYLVVSLSDYRVTHVNFDRCERVDAKGKKYNPDFITVCFELGELGWEAVGAVPAGGTGVTSDRYLFKRPKA